MQLSARGARMARASGVTTILEDIAAARSSGGEWLNLSAGNPAAIPEVVSTWQRLEADALADDFADSSCQYGPTRGSDGLVDAIIRYFNNRFRWGIGRDNIVIGPGSQMLCFIATSVFTGPSSLGCRPLVLPCVPDYTGYQDLCLDDGSVVAIEPFVEIHDARHFSYAVNIAAVRQTPTIGMILLSSPCNPTGRCIAPSELSALVRLAKERDIPLVIDHAYGEPFPRIAEPSAEPLFHPNVLNCFTFSKAGLPGERIGFAIGPAEVVSPMVSFLAKSTLHAPRLIQAVTERALNTGEIDILTAKVINPYYRRKRLVAERLLQESLPEQVSWRLHSGQGGMFCWLWIDEEWFNDINFYGALKHKKVSIVPGRHFFTEPFATPFLADHAIRCIRLSLSAEEPVLAEGISTIAEALRETNRSL